MPQIGFKQNVIPFALGFALIALIGLGFALVGNNQPWHPAQQISVDTNGTSSIDSDSDGKPDWVEVADAVLWNRPDYESAWITLVRPFNPTAGTHYLMHFLGGNPDDYKSEFICRGTGAWSGVHQRLEFNPQIRDINSQGIKLLDCSSSGLLCTVNEIPGSNDECVEYKLLIWRFR